MKLPITDDGIRPAGSPDKCFYCQSPKGQHTAECVCVQRTVVIEMKIRLVVDVPEDWTVDNIEFKYNGSSHCLSNVFDQIAGELEYLDNKEEGICHICHRAEAHYVREATALDHEELAYEVAKGEGQIIEGQPHSTKLSDGSDS